MSERLMLRKFVLDDKELRITATGEIDQIAVGNVAGPPTGTYEPFSIQVEPCVTKERRCGRKNGVLKIRLCLEWLIPIVLLWCPQHQRCSLRLYRFFSMSPSRSPRAAVP